MKSAVATVARRVPDDCHAPDCDKDKCSVDLTGAPAERIVVDMDCDSLRIPVERKRCDYLFVGEEPETVCVVPIELKSGRFEASATLEQLQAGVGMADTWLPQGVKFRLVPVLAHGKPIHPAERKRLLTRRIRWRKQKKGVVLIKCGEPLTKALRA